MPHSCEVLAHNSHQFTAPGAYLPHFAKAVWGRPEYTALGLDKGLDVYGVYGVIYGVRPNSLHVYLCFAF